MNKYISRPGILQEMIEERKKNSPTFEAEFHKELEKLEKKRKKALDKTGGDVVEG